MSHSDDPSASLTHHRNQEVDLCTSPQKVQEGRVDGGAKRPHMEGTTGLPMHLGVGQSKRVAISYEAWGSRNCV